MAYIGNIGTDQQVRVENRETQTVVSLVGSGLSQQQSQRNSFTTGSWVLPPTLFRTTNGYVLRIEGTQSQIFVGLQAGGMSTLETAPSLVDTDVLPLEQVAAEAHSTPQPLDSMQPMQPMQPMEMKPMEPMQMQMGNMRMQMGGPEPKSAKRFCSQCGHAVDQSDRFCSDCGNRLSS